MVRRAPCILVKEKNPLVDADLRRGRGARSNRVGRFETELRPYVLNEERESLTLQLWLDEFFKSQG